ncbi:MAG: hypothetical protein KDK34_09775, partial [Leptospiraceae bacterium]|nr:hypothetical protein [Leptospiraceae bacterium]
MSSARHPDKRRFPWHFRKRRPGVIESLAPVVVLILLLVASVLIFDEQAAISATDGPSQIALMIAGFVAAIIAFFQGARWHQLEQAVIQSIGFVTQTFLILLLV